MTKEDFDKFLKIKGQARGAVFQVDAKYIELKWGKDGLMKIKRKARELGYNIPYQDVEIMGWYPIGFRIISILLIKDVFNVEDEGIREMGTMAPKFSFIVKFLFKLFTPLKKFTEDIPRYWREHYTIGKLKVTKLSEKKKMVNLRLEGIKLHPIFCIYLEGYFEGVCKFLFSTSKCREESCEFKKSSSHDYLVTW